MARKTKKTKKDKKQDKKHLHVELINRMVTLSTSGFGLVAALAWNNVIQELVNTYIKKWLPQGSGLASLFIYALAVTILAVFVTYQLSEIARSLGADED